MRRRLVFNIPPGPETHYSDIKGEILGRVWAPLYHGYGYYLPKNKFPPENAPAIDAFLKLLSKDGGKHAVKTMLATLVFGVKPFLQNLSGAIAWAEGESIFASWDGHVTFGSSQVVAHATGFLSVALIQELIKNPFGWRSLLMIALFWFLEVPKTVKDWVKVWKNLSNYAAVSPTLPGVPMRIDNVAHIGGLVTGALNAAFLTFPYL